MKTTTISARSERGLLTPDKRDEIFRLFEKKRQENAYQLLSPESLRNLAKMRSERSPIVSVYLNLGPQRRLRGAWSAAFKELTKQTLAGMSDQSKREKMKQELLRVEEALAGQLPSLGRGAAFFACEEIGLWRQITVPMEFEDKIYFNAHPYLRPLIRTQDEYDRFAVAIMSLERSRFFISQIGTVEEVLDLEGPNSSELFSDSVPPGQRWQKEGELAKSEARALSKICELLCDQFDARYLLFSASPSLHAFFLSNFSKHVAMKIGGEFHIEPHSSVAEVAEVVRPLEQSVEAQEELAIVNHINDHVPARAVWGFSETAEALNRRLVTTLVADDNFHQSGAFCLNCGMLTVATRKSCAYCSGHMEAVPDIVDMALEKAILQKAKIDVIRSENARAAMPKGAFLGALLRAPSSQRQS